MQRITLSLFLIIVLLVFFGCTSEPLPNEERVGSIEIVESVPSELFHWFNVELSKDRGARVINKSYEDYSYYVATTGKQSVKNGEINIIEKDMESATWSIKLEYIYPDITERSLDTHFMIFKIPLNQPAKVSIVAVTGAENEIGVDDENVKER